MASVRSGGSGSDMPGQEKAEWGLGGSERQFRVLAETVPGVIFKASPEGSCEYVNQYFYDYTGMEAGSALGDGWARALHPRDLARNRSQWLRALREGRPYEEECRLRSEDGSYRWFMLRSRPVRDEAEEIVKWVGTCTDIHELKSAKSALREEDRRKDAFLAMLGHEIRNPLAPIQSSLELLEISDGDDESTARTAREVLGRQVGHLSRLVEDLLDVSRITRGKIRLRKRRVDLAEVLRGAIQDYRTSLDAGEVKLHCELPDRPVWMQADPTRIAQAVDNLLSNAEKFSEPGARVYVELEAEAESGTGTVVVRDTGIGMSEETLARIFEPFQQLGRDRRTEPGGMGLGLTLVKMLVELHGGTVRASSDGPGRGSSFRMELPLEASAADRSSSSGAGAGAAAGEGGAEGGRRILLVEDNPDAAETLSMMLRLRGHEVAVAADGAAGLARAREFGPEVVVCDIGLPGEMDGYEVARRFGADPELSSIALVAVTGYGQLEDELLGREAGFDAYLTKPVTGAVLERVLADLPA